MLWNNSTNDSLLRITIHESIDNSARYVVRAAYIVLYTRPFSFILRIFSYISTIKDISNLSPFFYVSIDDTRPSSCSPRANTFSSRSVYRVFTRRRGGRKKRPSSLLCVIRASKGRPSRVSWMIGLAR